MSPTRPVDNGPTATKAPKADSSRSSTARSENAAAAGQGSAASRGPAPQGRDTVAPSVAATAELVDTALEVVEQVGQERIEALKTQIRNGTFQVDTALLADRLLADAFGYELYVKKAGGKENG